MGIDPITEQNLFLALIGLIGALTIWLQQRNAAAGKARGDATQASLLEHNQKVQEQIIEPIQQIKQATNGKVTDLEKENADLRAKLAVYEATQTAKTP